MTRYRQVAKREQRGSRALGATVSCVVITDILPSAGAPVLVQASVLMAVGILIEAVLSFLGVGVRPDAVARAHAPDGRGFNDAGAVDR